MEPCPHLFFRQDYAEETVTRTCLVCGASSSLPRCPDQALSTHERCRSFALRDGRCSSHAEMAEKREAATIKLLEMVRAAPGIAKSRLLTEATASFDGSAALNSYLASQLLEQLVADGLLERKQDSRAIRHTLTNLGLKRLASDV
jgi:predicted transcriptional regulator